MDIVDSVVMAGPRLRMQPGIDLFRKNGPHRK
jgi:hypothetical protein